MSCIVGQLIGKWSAIVEKLFSQFINIQIQVDIINFIIIPEKEMGKTTQSRHIIRLTELKLVLEIQSDPLFHPKLLSWLNDKKHLINSLCTAQAIKRLQVFLRKQLQKDLQILQTYFAQQQNLSLQQKTQADHRLVNLLEIIRLLYKNDDFYQEDDKNLPFCNRLMTVTDNYEIQTKLIALLMNTSFQKTQKQFFYNIYFLCDHIDIHDLRDSGIQKLYQLGQTIKQFRFFFVQHSTEKAIVIDDFYQFVIQNGLADKHYRTVTDFLLKKFQIVMERDSMVHLALLSKVKLFMKSVKFNSDGTIKNSANEVVQAISYANAMYCYIEYFVLGQEITEHISIPNIFSFPPAYSEIFKELLEVFLLQGSNKQTHLTIMKSINQILQIQEKTSAIDVVGRLNDNSSLIYKYLSVAKEFLSNENPSLFTPSRKEKINLEAVTSNEFMLQLFKIMTVQVQQTHELNSIACAIVERIFKKQAICSYNDEVISEAGNLLMMIDYEEEKIVKTIVEKVQNYPIQSKPYLRILNDFFSKKIQRINQRRDLTYVARQSSESQILTKMEVLIQTQIQNGNIQRDSYLIETIQLISNICEESPTLLQTLQKTSSTILPFLFQIISSTEHIPADIQSITDVINFMHHVSLIDGPVRNTMLKRPMVSFITKILVMDKFSQALTRNVKTIGGYIVGSLSRFLTNIKVVGQYIFNGFISAAVMLNEEYKECSLAKLGNKLDKKIINWEDQRIDIQQSLIMRLLRCDSKLINLLKMVERTGSMILKKFKSRSLYMLLRPLLQISLERDNVFLDGSLEHSLLKMIINETMTAIKDYNTIMEAKENLVALQKSRSNRILQSISEINNQNSSSEQQHQQQASMAVRHERLITENSEQSQANQQNPQDSNHQPIEAEQMQPQVQAQNIQNNQEMEQENQQPNEPAESSDDSGLQLFEQLICQSQGDEDMEELQEVVEGNDRGDKSQKVSNDSIQMQQEKKSNPFTEGKEFFMQLTWKNTRELVAKYEALPQQVVSKLYQCYEPLDHLILPLMQDTTPQGEQLKYKITRQISQNSIMDEVQRQTIISYQTNSKHTSYSFNLLNILITIYSSKLQRILKLMQSTINFTNPEFNLPEYETMIENYSHYLTFYLQIVSQTNARNIFAFIQNDDVKFLETSKLPKSRVQNKTMDVQNLRKSLQIQLNDRWTIFNVLFDSFLRLISGSLSSPTSKDFLKKPQGMRHFHLICSSVIEQVKQYLLTKILPILKSGDVSVKDFQRYRQSMKVIMQIFMLNDGRSYEKGRSSEANLLITLCIHKFDSGQDSIADVLARLAIQQEQINMDDDEMAFEDNKENRWKYIKKVFLKMTFFKIKHFLAQGFSQEIQPIQDQQNRQENSGYTKQMKKNYFVFSRIHKLICTFLNHIFFAKNKNSYVRDLILFNASQFSNFCQRITNEQDLIYYNYIFEDDPAKQMTEDEFFTDVNARNSDFMFNIMSNMDKSVLNYLPMVIKAVFQVEKPRDQKFMAKFNESIKERFFQISRKINQIYESFTNYNLDFGFSLPRKKSSILSNSFLPKISEKIDEELDEEPQLDLKEYVLKLNNLFGFVIEFIKYFKSNQYFEQGHPKISVNYVKSMVEFGTFLLSNFQVQKHFPQQADEIVHSIIIMVEEFCVYKQTKQAFIKQSKDLRKKERHAEKKRIYRGKKIKKRNKDLDSDSRSNYTNQFQDLSASHNIPAKQSKKQNKKNKVDKNYKKTTKKTVKRQRPAQFTPKPKQKKPLKQQTITHQVQPKGCVLNRVVTDFIKIALTASQQRPYLYASTVQLITRFLQNYSKDVVLRSESDINNLKSGKKYKVYKNKFFVLGAQLFGDLLKVKLKNEKFEGFFYLITYLGMKLMTQPHVKVDFQCAIKRFFYQHELKFETMPFSCTPKDRYRIKMSDFQDYMVQDKLRDLPDLSYLLTIVEEKKKDPTQARPCGRKKDEDYIEQFHEFTRKNYKKFSNLKQVNSIYVKLKNSLELDVINLPSIKRKKPAHGQDEQKKVRFFEYHPEGDFAALICQIINHIVKIVLKELIQTLNGSMQQKSEGKQVLHPFNLKILLYSLQVLSRQSPTIVPWIARFKCKKILVNEIKAYGLTPESEGYKKIISYVYGATDLPIQSFTEVSFLSLLVKFIYPVSQISTFLFELCLDNNVLLQDKSQKAKDQKQNKQKKESDNQIKKWATFGSIIRQKIVSQLQSQLAINKNFDEAYIKSGFNTKKQSFLIVKKVSCMGLLTILLSIREFAKLCIESNFIKKLQEEYMRTSVIIRAECNSNSETQLSLSSSIMRNFLINYFLRPLQILQELSIQYQIAKKQSQYRFTQQFTNTNRVHIRFILTSDTINDQLFGNDIFFKSKFKTEWFYANNLEGDEAVEFDDEMSERMRSEGSQNGYDGMFDDSSDEDGNQPLDQEIEEENDASLSMSGNEILSDEDVDMESQENPQWYGSQDPFDRESNTFENFILYPNEDHVLEDDDDEDDEDDDQESVDMSQDRDIDDIEDEDLIDSYDDSEDNQNQLQIQLSPNDANLLFPIDQNSADINPFWPFGQEGGMSVASTHTVPQVGIYYYFIPYEPQRRDHPNHICNNSSKPQIKQLENLYEIFMDVVSFENIMITNNMVKLQNQQAKLIRKLFKVAAYKNHKNQTPLHNEHIFKLQEEYYNQLYKIFTLDTLFFVSEKIDFRQCDKPAHYLQSLPIHYIDMYMDESELYFNEITKPSRGRRRGMFLNAHMERIRRPEHGNFRSMISRFRSMESRVGIRRPGQPPEVYLASQSSSDNSDMNEDENPEQNEANEEEGEANAVVNRIQFNIQNPNGGDVNFNTDLHQILASIGMSEREFMNLPNDVQSDIIQNSLQSQLQNGDGNLNMLIDRFGGNDGVQAPNVSPVMQAHQSEPIEEQQSQIQMPESFDMPQQNHQASQRQLEPMQQENQPEPQEEDTPINEINNENQIVQEEALPERYRKISLQHSQKISKDIIEILNKDHKNDSKFPQIQEDFLEEIFESIFVLQCKDFCRFPYSLLNMNMINSKNCSKVISSLLTLLALTPQNSQLNSMIQGKNYGQTEIQVKRKSTDLLPKLSLRTYLYQISKDYTHQIYPNISIKILHILENLTKNYSISMQMLKVNNNPLKTLEKYLGSQQENYLSSFQTLIRLLHSITIRDSPVMVEQILRITNNVVSHYFEKNIFYIHQQQKELKESKKNTNHNPTITQNKIDTQNQGQPSILPVSLQSKSEIISSLQIHKAIQLSDYSIELLCSLLMSDELRESQNLSELIMKLSINGKNLILFIKNIEAVLEKLCQRSTIFLNKEKKQLDEDGKNRSLAGSQVQQTQIDDLMKVFCLLEIFSSMIKEFKQFAYRHHIDRYDFIMQKFRNIIESKSLFTLCETIASIISTTGQGNQLIKNIPEIFQIFFVVFSINIELESKNGEEDKNVIQEKHANKIASLGQINEKHNSSANKIQQQSASSEVYLIQNHAFNKLWNEKMCSPNGRLLLNLTIKRKLSTLLKKKREIQSMSLFDLPMIKIIMNSPHLLDFENKRALFRAQMKRLKRKKLHDRVIYISLDRKEVFQQSYNIIMGKKPQELKNRVKIDFEGEQGEDAGGLTREWYQLLSTEMFNPNYGLFRPSSTGNTYQPSSMSYVNSEHLNYFKFIGRVMGKALFDGYMLDAYFTPAFYKHILKIPITYLDMQEEDYEYFNSLKWILDNAPIDEYMDLDFTYEFDNFGEIKTKELITNGEKVRVNEENKWRYVQLICYAKMATAVQSQLEMFLEGLHEIVPHKYLKIFDPKQLEIMISGLPTIDIADLKRNTELVNYQKTDQIIIWLFEVLQTFDMSLRTAFLQFVTGTSKVPPEGFKGLNGYNGPQKFTIQKEFDAKKLPRAHTCFNQLDLPPYTSKQMLIEKLTYAITEGKEGFGIA